jgi:multiple antibiotic resistance protein
MMPDVEFLLEAPASIVAIRNPISTAAVYSVLTEKADPPQRKKSRPDRHGGIPRGALTGQFLFTILGHTLPAFKIAGGILLVSFATGMLSVKREHYSPEELENIAIVPLAFPLTCGAGTPTTVILIASEAEGLFQNAMVMLAILVAIALFFLALTDSDCLFRFIGEHELRILTKFLAIFMLAIAIQFMIGGLSGAMPEILTGVGICTCP